MSLSIDPKFYISHFDLIESVILYIINNSSLFSVDTQNIALKLIELFQRFID